MKKPDKKLIIIGAARIIGLIIVQAIEQKAQNL